MNTKKIKEILIGTISVMGLLIAILAIHIYLVTRPKAPDAYTIAMARIDLKQNIDEQDNKKISDWLSQQDGIDHVLVNTKTQIAVFTFYPAKTSADKIVSNFKRSLTYKADRFIPTEAQLKSGCPINSNSPGYIVSKYLKQIF